MKKYIVKVNREVEINADNEDDAITVFFDEMAIANDSIENYVEVKEIEDGILEVKR